MAENTALPAPRAPSTAAGSLPLVTQPTGASRFRSLAGVFRGSTLAGAILIAVVLLLALGAPLFDLHDPQTQDVANRLLPPALMDGGTWSHPLGTDGLGRDLWARILWGLRTSLLVSIPAVVVAAGVGVVVGTLGGHFGGVVDALLMRVTDIQMAFPFIILAIAIMSVTRPTPAVLVVVLSLSAWPIYARVVRSIAMVDSRSEYVLAARAMGASHLRILTRYLLRNLGLSVVVLSTLDVATMIVLEALLSFLGLGIQPPTPSLGSVMADGREYMSLGIWWITTLPGVAILVTLLGLNLMGDGLQAQLDPRLRKS